MDLDPASLVTAFCVSSVGFVLFYFGRKMQELRPLVAGLLLMGFPYFVSGFAWMLLGAALILGGLWAWLHFAP